MKAMTYGIVADMFVERGIDNEEMEKDGTDSVREATQADFDRF